ncbi:MAG: ion transporter [Paludibacteraceae bacterium]
MNLNKIWHRIMSDEKLKRKIYIIIFESDTPAGRMFDVLLIGFILLSVLIVIMDSVLPVSFAPYLHVLEWVFTVFFTMEYILRIYCAKKPKKYIFSFFGMVDLMSTLPTYLSIFFGGAHSLLVIRIFRLIRVFRVFKLFNFLSEGHLLLLSLKESSRKIIVFFIFVVLLVISIGTIMYIVEGREPDSAFSSIPKGIYWAVVTLTTVGYGDITPVTPLGQFLSVVVMLLGYTILAVPTGIVSASMIDQHRKGAAIPCPHCHRTGHELDAGFCKYCGKRLKVDSDELMEKSEAITQDGEIK